MEVYKRKVRRSGLAVLCVVLSISLLWGCSIQRPESPEIDDMESRDQEQIDPMTGVSGADVISVEAAGGPNAFTFSVGIASPDEGCDQYADWWEVLTEEGDLVYRRILTHSHVDEQPFVRSGGPVAIDTDTVVIVRAHMHPDGYGGTIMMGTVDTGFEEIPFDPDFALQVEDESPQPTGCAF